MANFDQTKYINDFIKETYDTIKLQVPKGEKERIKKHSKEKGYKSVNSYLKALIDADMNEVEEKKSIHVHDNKGVIIGDNGTINMSE